LIDPPPEREARAARRDGSAALRATIAHALAERERRRRRRVDSSAALRATIACVRARQAAPRKRGNGAKPAKVGKRAPGN
jgi:hypothetical protein